MVGDLDIRRTQDRGDVKEVSTDQVADACEKQHQPNRLICLVMILYLDTNVYRMITACQESTAVRQLIRSKKLTLLVSQQILLETWAISDLRRRREEAEVIAKLANRFEKWPTAHHHAKEVRSEHRRVRPHWLRTVAFESTAKRFLKDHRITWHKVKQGWIPPGFAYQVYHRVAEPGIRTIRESQKNTRAIRRERYTEFFVGFGEHEPNVLGEIRLDDPEIAWRLECLTAWHAAIVQQIPASRDLMDYLGPNLTPQAFTDPRSSWSFWMEEVDSKRLPRNRLSGLASYFQLDYKTSHGNPGDALHANHLLDVDLFVTADATFFQVLRDIRNLMTCAARVALVDRAATSAAGELCRVLEDVA